MDEPDRSLSLAHQIALFAKFLPNLAVWHQVIVATHSPCVLRLAQESNAHIIDMSGTLDTTQKMFSEYLANGWSASIDSMITEILTKNKG